MALSPPWLSKPLINTSLFQTSACGLQVLGMPLLINKCGWTPSCPSSPSPALSTAWFPCETLLSPMPCLQALFSRFLSCLGYQLPTSPSLETVRNTFIIPKPFKCTTRPSSGICSESTCTFPLLSGFTSLFDFIRVKCHLYSLTSLRFSSEEYQLSKRT